MVYPVDYAPFKYNVMVAIYSVDGSVKVSHGGIECGQGINTKVQYTTTIILYEYKSPEFGV